MSNLDKEVKVKLNPIRIILIFVVTYIISVLLFYSVIQPWKFFNTGNFADLNPFTNFVTYIYMGALLILAAIFCVLSIKKTYYVLDSKKIEHYKMGNCDIYHYSDIVYIDEEWSKKHKMLHFYLRSGKSRTLAFDKEGLIYRYAIEHVRQMSFEEFRMKYPNAK